MRDDNVTMKLKTGEGWNHVGSLAIDSRFTNTSLYSLIEKTLRESFRPGDVVRIECAARRFNRTFVVFTMADGTIGTFGK